MKTWHKISIGVLVGSIVLLTLMLGRIQVSDQTTATSQTTPVEYKPATRDELFALVNAEREKAGVAPLQMDERLNQSAQAKADDMVANNYYDHESPTTGKKGYTYVDDYAQNACSYRSESLEGGSGAYSTASSMVSDWMGSKSHRDALLNSRYTLTGIGVVQDRNGGWLAVQHFCDTTWDKKCDDVTSNDYNWNNDMLCTNTDGTRFYTSYGGAKDFLAQ